jgi:DNA invertase Pin-like site-specific DNA recombinase
MPNPSDRRVAQYLRMSTEHQNYSLEYQSACNRAYADERGLEIVRSYVDAGVSGLRLSGRDGLKQLLADVLGQSPGYGGVLVYDVSRWGRFQDVDQGAHYEFVCREAGVSIIYTAEPFPNDGSLTSAILKQLKRAMAAEFSRDLSAKTGRAQRGLRLKGFWQGGPPGYGLRRVAVTPSRQPRLQMEFGQQKAIRGDRTTLAPGPDHEVRTVRRIYSLFVTGGMKMAGIVRLLRSEGVEAEGGARWTVHRVRQVLTNEKYAGVLVCGKSSNLLGMRTHVPRHGWLRVEGALEPLVSARTFLTAQAQIPRPKPRGLTDEALLAELRQVLAQHGRLSTLLINAHPAAHCSDAYKRRFGSMEAAYARIGYAPSCRQIAAAAKARQHRPHTFRAYPELIDPEAAIQKLRAHRDRNGHVSSTTIKEDGDLPSPDWYRERFGGMAAVYALVGHTPTRRQQHHLELNRSRRSNEGPARGG